MAKQKKPIHQVQMTEGKRNIIHQLLEEYDIQTAEDIQDALKDLLGGTIKEMMEAEMDEHLGYPQIDSKHLRCSIYLSGAEYKRSNFSSSTKKFTFNRLCPFNFLDKLSEKSTVLDGTVCTIGSIGYPIFVNSAP